MQRYDVINDTVKQVTSCSYPCEYGILVKYYERCCEFYKLPVYRLPRNKLLLLDMDSLLFLFENDSTFDILNVISTFIDIYIKFHQMVHIELESDITYEEIMYEINKSKEENKCLFQLNL